MMKSYHSLSSSWCWLLFPEEWCDVLVRCCFWNDSYSERFFFRVASRENSSLKICQNLPQNQFRRCTWNHSKLRFIHSILHFSNNNNNIHGSINDDECIKNTRRFLKIYPRETSRREVKLWSGLSRYFDRVNEFCCLTRTEKKGDRSFVRLLLYFYTTTLVHINRGVVRNIDTSSSSSSFWKTGILACLDGYMNIAMEHTEVRTVCRLFS